MNRGGRVFMKTFTKTPLALLELFTSEGEQFNGSKDTKRKTCNDMMIATGGPGLTYCRNLVEQQSRYGLAPTWARHDRHQCRACSPEILRRGNHAV